MVSKLTAFKSSDGSLWEEESAAAEHELYLIAKAIYSEEEEALRLTDILVSNIEIISVALVNIKRTQTGNNG